MEVVNLLADAYNKFRALPVFHGSDIHEFQTHTHALQNIVMARDAVINHPDQFHNQSNKHEGA